MSDEENDTRQGKWKTANQLSREYVGGHELINRKLINTRRSLVAELIEQAGMSWEEATYIVETRLVGRGDTTGKRGSKAFQAAPEAIRLLDLERRSDVPLAQSDWRSAHQLSRSYVGGWNAMVATLHHARNAMIAEAASRSGSNPEEAAEIVNLTLIGWRRPIGGGKKALYASPDAVARLEREDKLIQKSISFSASTKNILDEGRTR